jgi:hypothetical protein
MNLLTVLIGLFAVASCTAGTVVYDNTAADTGFVVSYSTGQYTAIGDQIQPLPGPRMADFAAIQLYNGGDAAGTFTATLRFFDLGASNPDLSDLDLHQAGSDFVVAQAPVGPSGTSKVLFALSGFAIPDLAIFTVSVSNASPGLDLGLLLFDPPAAGSSDNAWLVVKDGGAYQPLSTLMDVDNVYLELQATPEPATFALVCLALAIGGARLATRRIV